MDLKINIKIFLDSFCKVLETVFTPLYYETSLMHYYEILDKRNTKLITKAVDEARNKGLKEVTVKLYNAEPAKFVWY